MQLKDISILALVAIQQSGTVCALMVTETVLVAFCAFLLQYEGDFFKI